MSNTVTNCPISRSLDRAAAWTTLLLAGAMVIGFMTSDADSSAPANPMPIASYDGLAIAGYDPVAYFTDGEPLSGDPAITWDWNGATWRFTTTENRALFQAEPERYAPQLGGYSVYGLTRGKTYHADPTVFDIIDGRLYLSRNDNVRSIWQRNPEGYLHSARQAWERGGR